MSTAFIACSPIHEDFSFSRVKTTELRINNGFIGQVYGMNIDNMRRIYCADRKLDKIWIFNNRGRLLNNFGQSGRGPGDLGGPVDVKTYKDTIIVLESGNLRISFFDSSTKFIKSFNITNGQPTGFEVFGEDRRLIVSESLGVRNYDIYTFSGKQITKHSMTRPGKYLLPLRIPGGQMSAINDKYILFSSITKYFITKINSEGDTIATYSNSPGGFYSPDLNNQENYNRNKNWALVGKPLSIGKLFVFQWVKRDVDNKGIVSWDYYVDIFNESGQLLQEKVLSPHLFLYTDHRYVYAMEYDQSDTLDSNTKLLSYELVNKNNT